MKNGFILRIENNEILAGFGSLTSQPTTELDRETLRFMIGQKNIELPDFWEN